MNGGTAGVLIAGLILAVVVMILGVNALSKKPAADRPAATAPTAGESPPTAKATELTPQVADTAQAKERTALEEWKSADLFVPAKTLFDAYAQGGNTIATDQKYKGKKLATTGTVLQVDTDPLGRGVLALTVGELPIEVVVCLFDKRHVGELATLQPNQAAAVVGTCQGRSQLGFGVSLEHCRLLHAAADPAALDRWIRGTPAR